MKNNETYGSEGKIEVRDSIDVSWHYLAFGNDPLDVQLQMVQMCVDQIEGLIQLTKEGIIELAFADSSPSVAYYEVIKLREYDQKYAQWPLPSRFWQETERGGWTDVPVPDNWDYSQEHKYKADW